MAEIAYNFSRFNPLPRSDVHLHELRVGTKKTARISRVSLKGIGLDTPMLEASIVATQRIGAAAAFLEYDSILVPSLRWDTDNLVIFADIHGFDLELKVAHTKNVDWIEWRDAHS